MYGFAQILNLDTHTFTIGQIVDCLLLLLYTKKYASESVEHLTSVEFKLCRSVERHPCHSWSLFAENTKVPSTYVSHARLICREKDEATAFQHALCIKSVITQDYRDDIYCPDRSRLELRQ